MKKSNLEPNGWITVQVSAGNENWAKNLRAERDAQYGNIFQEESTDERWVGDLGELVFHNWLKYSQVGYEWITSDAAGQPDFVSKLGIKIGVKTVKRHVPMSEDYTAQITAKHAHEPIHQFFFMSYEIDKRKMWMLGGIDKESYLAKARYYGEGEKVHAHYTIRKGHEIYNLPVTDLLKPNTWLEQIFPPDKA